MLRTFRRFRRADDGTAVIEFALVAPFFFLIMFGMFDLGTFMLRQVTLKSAVDRGARIIRLDGTLDPGNPNPTPAELRDDYVELICDFAVMVRDCDNELVIDMQPVARGAANFPDMSGPCLERLPNGTVTRQSTTFNQGNRAEIVLVRVCAPVEAIMGSLSFYNTTSLVESMEGDVGKIMVRAHSAFLFE